MKIENVKRYILNHALDVPNRKREKVYRRAIVSRILLDENFSLSEIGRLFNKDHATIIHAKRMYSELMQYKDFKRLDKEVRNEIKYDTLEDKINKCVTLEDFQQLQTINKL